MNDHVKFTLTANNTTQRVPCPVVEPVVEVVEALLSQVPGGPVVEVRVELVDHALEAQHREQPRRERYC